MKKLLTLLGLDLLSSCSTSTPEGSARRALARPMSERIHWPEKYQPDKSECFVHNEIGINAPAQRGWDIPGQAEAWPQWYVGAENVKSASSKSGRLAADANFTWKTMGINWNSLVKELSPPWRLATESRKQVIQGYHAWLLMPTSAGCRVITDESFRGPLGLLQGTFIPNKLHRLHQIFLEELKKKAEKPANPTKP